VDTADNNDRIDDDILQSREDILRAREAVSPLEHEGAQEPARQAPAEQKDAIRESGEPAPQEEAGERACPLQKSEIPRFDLSEDIMAEQRRITAIRRKAPAEKKEPDVQEREVESAGQRFEPVKLGGPREEKIISQIVARDIERLLRGEAADG